MNRTSGHDRPRGPRELCAGGEWLYGRQPVIETLRAGRRTVHEAVLPPPEKGEADELAWIRQTAHARRIPVHTADARRLEQITRGGHHQGVALKASPYPYVDFADVLADVRTDERALVVVLDHLTDPQNIGAILRTASAVGVTGVILPEDRGAGVTPAAVRASAGMSEHLRVARVVNLPRAMRDLKDAGTWFTGLDWGKDARRYTDIDFTGRSGLVVGAEGTGITRLVRDTCDFIAVLPMPGAAESLNAGVAAAVCLYEMLRQRG